MNVAVRHIHALISSKARRGEEWADPCVEYLNGKVDRAEKTETVEQFQEGITRAIDAGATEIWIGGGDGTVRQAAERLINSNIVLGILPFGTGNALATELGIPAHPTESVDFLLAKAETRPIDAGRFNGEIFVNVATVGLTSFIAKELKHQDKGKLGRLAYVPSLFRAITSLPAFRLRIETDGEIFNQPVVQFVAASTRNHGGPFAVTKDAAIDDGKLSIYAVPRKALVSYLLSMLVGHHTDLPAVWSADVAKLRVTVSRDIPFILDGDERPARTAEIEIVAGGLLVLAEPIAED